MNFSDINSFLILSSKLSNSVKSLIELEKIYYANIWLKYISNTKSVKLKNFTIEDSSHSIYKFSDLFICQEHSGFLSNLLVFLAQDLVTIEITQFNQEGTRFGLAVYPKTYYVYSTLYVCKKNDIFYKTLNSISENNDFLPSCSLSESIHNILSNLGFYYKLGLAASPEKIYFISQKVDNKEYVKIGYSSNPDTRVACLQTGSPLPLNLLCTIYGDKTTEAELHKRFREFKIRGEWFEVKDSLWEYLYLQLLD